MKDTMLTENKNKLCNCFFCITGKTHNHGSSYMQWEIGSRLLVAESLDPKDRQPTKTCTLCGHTEDLVE